MITIEKKEHKPLLGREEIKAISDDQVTPSMASIQEYLATELKKDKELIVVKKVYPSFGKQKADILVYVYDSKELLNKFEPKKKEKKKVEAK
jgi:small subunit ribosomal protein S24e